MEAPSVSVICVCYNQAPFVVQAMNSVLRQSELDIQLIVVDDASTDNSVDVIRQFAQSHPRVIFLPLSVNGGNCKAFNSGFAISSGNFIIDLAADDEFMPQRVVTGLKRFHLLGPDYGVHFTDAELIDENGKRLGYHSDRYPHSSIPEGDIYAKLIERYFINSPSMMIRRAVLDRLGGYDETLAYEDFDFWIRSSRDWKYAYTPEALVRRRIVKGSLARQQYVKGSRQLESTFRVCQKIVMLNRTEEERKTTKRRIMYEMRRALRLGEWRIAWEYLRLQVNC